MSDRARFDRRSILGLFGLGALVAASPKLLELGGPAPKTLLPFGAGRSYTIPNEYVVIKEVLEDDLYGVITESAHPSALWPGVKAWWGREYADGLGGQSRYGDLFDVDA